MSLGYDGKVCHYGDHRYILQGIQWSNIKTWKDMQACLGNVLSHLSQDKPY